MAELEEFEQQQADLIAERLVAQGVEPSRAAEMAKSLVLQAVSAGMQSALQAEQEDPNDLAG